MSREGKEIQEKRRKRKGEGDVPSKKLTVFVNSVLMALHFMEEEPTDQDHVDLQSPPGVFCPQLILWR